MQGTRKVARNPRLKRPKVRRFRVFAISDAASAGKLRVGSLHFPVSIGKGGVRANKREGDGATPMGRWKLTQLFYRPDRLRRPPALMPVAPLSANSGWCDDPSDRNYNRKVVLPYPGSAERLWREDGLYDVVGVLSHNRLPRVKGRGSAIFMHVAQPNLAPTAGCIALRREHLTRLLLALGRHAVFAIGKNLPSRSVPATDGSLSLRAKRRRPASTHRRRHHSSRRAKPAST
ncbi:MAG TPA: L,D-transpeptidase family protein [Hyphomicrobiales bacterium]|nr:L,D-transpeptidase family protein [Hyphomicrobiales bacterium]